MPALKKPSPSPAVTAVSRLLLGGSESPLVDDYWGFSYDEFVEKLTVNLKQHLMLPEEAAAAMVSALGEQATAMSAEAGRDAMAFLKTLDGMTNPVHRITPGEVSVAIDALPVIGLNGPIGSGKDTLAEPIVQEYGFSRMSFADPLRAAGVILYRIPLRYFNDRELKETPLPGINMSPRKTLQLLGTEVIRSIREDFWAHRLSLRVASHVYGAVAPDSRGPAPNGIVIADVRFQNEADYVRERKLGFLGRIRRPDVESASKAKGSGHASEAGITDAPGDVTIMNAGGLDTFKRSGINALRGAQALQSPAAPGAALLAIRARMMETVKALPQSALFRPERRPERITGQVSEALESSDSSESSENQENDLEIEGMGAGARPRIR